MKVSLSAVILGIALVITLGLLGKVGWSNYQLDKVNNTLNEKLMEADLEIGRAETRFGDAEVELEKLEEDLQKEIKEKNAHITRYGELLARYRVAKAGAGKIEYVQLDPVELPCKPTQEFQKNYLYQAKTDRTLVPIHELRGTYMDHYLVAQCRFYPKPSYDDKDYGPYSAGQAFYFQYQAVMDFAGQFVETLLPDGGINHYAKLYVLNEHKEPVDSLEIEKFTYVVRDQREKRMHWWTPQLDIGILAGYHTSYDLKAGGTLGISFMGWGKSDDALTLRFPRVSLDITTEVGLGLTPVLYNLGDVVPLVRDLWIGPHIMWGFGDQAMLGLTIGSIL